MVHDGQRFHLRERLYNNDQIDATQEREYATSNVKQ